MSVLNLITADGTVIEEVTTCKYYGIMIDDKRGEIILTTYTNKWFDVSPFFIVLHIAYLVNYRK